MLISGEVLCSKVVDGVGLSLLMFVAFVSSLVHGSSPVQEAIIKPCPDHQSALEMVVEDIAKIFDQKPVVVVHNPGQEAYFIQQC